MSGQREALPLAERLLNQIAHVDLGIAARFPDITGATKELLTLSDEAAALIQSQAAEIERLARELDKLVSRNAVLNADGIAARKGAANNYARAEAAQSALKRVLDAVPERITTGEAE